ncbi:hypothetical protein BG011_005459 [Mortierella polycephala]|uniref:Uncharacterized protein n=1 Tax=Mortierella polycephala TaxID=41804 RepID=A0A9P6PYN2_9FUNG|nr:hypothetical protein BG011_005459 [Mortierella polycephala]
MNKHLQQPASLGTPPTSTHNEEQINRPKKHHTHGPTTQSTFKTNPAEQNQQQNSGVSEATAKNQQHHGTIKKTSGSHPQKIDL